MANDIKLINEVFANMREVHDQNQHSITPAEIYAKANGATGSALETLKKFSIGELIQKAITQERLMREHGDFDRADLYRQVIDTLEDMDNR